MQLAADDQGNAIAAWRQSGAGGIQSLFGSVYNAVTGQWSTATSLESWPYDVVSGFSVSIRGTNAAVSFMTTEEGIADVWCTRFANGTWFGMNLVESSAGTASASSVAVDGAGNIMVGWTQESGGINRVYASRFTSSNSTWSLPGSPLDAGGVSATGPQVGFDAAGNGFAVWAQGNNVYARRYDRVTGWAASTNTLDSNNNAAVAPALSVDSLGNAIVAWVQSDGVADSIFAARYTIAGGWVGAVPLDSAATAVLTNPGSYDVVVVASIRGNNAAVAWRQKTGLGDSAANNTEIWVNRWNGSSWIGAEVATSSPGVFGRGPGISVDFQGNTSVSWTQMPNSAQALLNRFLVNAPSGGATMFSYGTNPTGYMETAFDATENGIAVFTATSGGVTKLYARRYDKLTDNWGGVAILETASGAVESSWVSLSLDDAGNAIVVWQWKIGSTVSTHAKSAAGRASPWSATQLVGSTSIAGAQAMPTNIAGAVGSENNAAVAWIQDGNAYIRRWNGVAWSAADTVDNLAAAASNVSVAIDLHGNVVATWLQNDASGPSIHHNRYAVNGTGGSWVGASSLDASASAVTLPKVVADAAGNFIAAWIQGNTVVARRFTNNAWDASATTISTGSVAPEELTLSADSMGNAVLAWTRSFSGVRSVFANTYIAGAGWRVEVLIESSTLTASAPYASGEANLTSAMRAGRAVVAWSNASDVAGVTNLFQARWDGASWSPMERVDNTNELTGGSHVSVAIDSQGNTSSIWNQLVNGVDKNFTNRFAADTYSRTSVSDGFGRVTTYTQDSRGRVVSVKSPAVNGINSETRYTYDTDGNVVTVLETGTFGSRTSIRAYDTRGNVIAIRDPDGTVTRRTFDANNQLITESVYLQPEAAPTAPIVPLITRYIYSADNESHLLYKISADGRVTQYVYDTPGQLTNELVYTASFYTASSFTLAQLNTWAGTAANAANLQRSDFAYNWRGALSTVTKWSSTNASGAGTGTPSVTRYTYNQRAQLLSTITARGEPTAAADYITTYTYDGLGRALDTTEWISGSVSRLTRNSYDDANNRMTVTLANGLVVTSLFDRSGRVINVNQGGTGLPTTLTTTYAYNASGQLAMVTDATGARSLIYYDEKGRKGAEVGADGALTTYTYNRNDQLLEIYRYSSPLSATTLASLVSGNVPHQQVDQVPDRLRASRIRSRIRLRATPTTAPAV